MTGPAQTGRGIFNLRTLIMKQANPPSPAQPERVGLESKR
jgi:hypothetical protein